MVTLRKAPVECGTWDGGSKAGWFCFHGDMMKICENLCKIAQTLKNQALL
jgi:hypothetical protein